MPASSTLAGCFLCVFRKFHGCRFPKRKDGKHVGNLLPRAGFRRGREALAHGIHKLAVFILNKLYQVIFRAVAVGAAYGSIVVVHVVVNFAVLFASAKGSVDMEMY